MTKLLACILCILVVSGCASASVQRGALIGAGAGVLVGGSVGYVVTDPKLLGSPKTKDGSNLSVSKADGLLAGIAIGAVFGAIVGAMVGHRRDEGYDMPEKQAPSSAPAASNDAPKTTAERDARAQAARAPYLRGL